MKYALTGVILLSTALFSMGVQADIVGKEVTYRAGKTLMKGYIAYDNQQTRRRPGVLVVHEWWGLNDYARIRARQLAKLGYTAMAVDMYGNGRHTEHPKDASAFAASIRKNLPLMKQRFEAAMRLLKDDNTVLNNRIAAIGYCFGGGVVLEMARQGEKLRGVVSFHGSLSTQHPAQKGKLRAQILVLNGEADPFTSPAQLAAFKQEMTEAGAKFQVISYPGAKHAFTNPAATYIGKKYDLPLAYDKAADEASWKEMRRFLARVLD